MNYIKDNGASFLVEALRQDSLPSIKKISLGDNQCTEKFKKLVRKITSVIKF